MSTYRISITYERKVTFFLDAPSRDSVFDFLEVNQDWQPGDVPGLIDLVSDEEETDHSVELARDKVTANFGLENGELVEL